MDMTLEEFIELLQDIKEDVDFENCTTLIDDHVLDSFDILSIISTLNDEFDISVPAAEIVPDPGQGILAVQGRAEEAKAPWLDALHDPDTSDCATAERAFSARLNGGCSAPVGAYARITGSRIELIGFFADEARGIKLRASLTGPREEARALGERLAETMLREAR